MLNRLTLTESNKGKDMVEHNRVIEDLDAEYHIKQQAKFFSDAKNIHEDLPASYAYWHFNYVQPFLSEFYGSDDFYVSSIKHWAKHRVNGRPITICSVGCGEAKSEIQLCKILLSSGFEALKFHCIDIAPGAISRAKEYAHNQGLSRYFNFAVEDYSAAVGVESYDIVIATQVLHHIVELERFFTGVRKSIEDTGCFLTIDMIGRNGHMLWPEALLIVDRIWSNLPRKFKYNHLFQRFEDVWSNWDHSKEDNEGIRAQDVLRLLIENFSFNRYFVAGNMAPAIFGRQFGLNFDPNNPSERILIDTISRLDHDLISIGYLKPTILYGMMSCHADAEPIHPDGRNPTFYIRNIDDYAILRKEVFVEVGSLVKFGERLSSSEYLDSGWSSPEPGGVWSNAPIAKIVLPIKSQGINTCDQFLLNISALGHVSPNKPRLSVTVMVNGLAHGKFTFSKPGVLESLSVNIAGQPGSNGSIEIQFHFDDTRSPAELGESRDIRRLGMFLSSLSIELVGTSTPILEKLIGCGNAAKQRRMESANFLDLSPRNAQREEPEPYIPDRILHSHPLPLIQIDSFAAYQAYGVTMEAEYNRRLGVEESLIGAKDGFITRGYCYVCNKSVDFQTNFLYALPDTNGRLKPNWREHLLCPDCGLNNRMRAAIHIFEQECNPQLCDSIYLTEQKTPLYKWFTQNYSHVTGSEYLGSKIPYGLGDDQGGIRNETLTALTFADNQFNQIFSFDVFEHIPRYESALRECLRCLKPGGHLIFTVPFTRHSVQHVTRARIVLNGEVEHILPPEYHGDPLNDKGVLCFYHFGWELLEQLRSMGFGVAAALLYWSTECGYLGQEQIIFKAKKL